MGEDIRIFHIEIIHLIGCNITTVIVIIFTESTFKLFDQLIPKIRTYLDSGVQQFCVLFWIRTKFFFPESNGVFFKEPLSPYGKFQNVFLSEKELEDIRQTIPDWKDYIERLSGYMASTGKQYQNHAATIISWARQDHPASRQRNYESEEYETL